MNVSIETRLRNLLRGKFSSLCVSFNDHTTCYETAEEAESRGKFEHVEWVSAEEKRKAIESNSVWLLHWYPDTPVAFYCVGASSLEACVRVGVDSAQLKRRYTGTFRQPEPG